MPCAAPVDVPDQVSVSTAWAFAAVDDGDFRPAGDDTPDLVEAKALLDTLG